MTYIAGHLTFYCIEPECMRYAQPTHRLEMLCFIKCDKGQIEAALQGRGLLLFGNDEDYIAEDRSTASKAGLQSSKVLLGNHQGILLPELSNPSRQQDSAVTAALLSDSLQQRRKLELSDAMQRHRTWLESVLAR